MMHNRLNAGPNNLKLSTCSKKAIQQRMKLNTCLVSADALPYDEISTAGFKDQLKSVQVNQCSGQSLPSKEAGSLVECAYNRQRDEECVLMCSMSTKSNQCFTFETESEMAFKKDGTICGFHYPEPFACTQGKCLLVVSTDTSSTDPQRSIQALKQPEVILPSVERKEWYESTPFLGYDIGILAVGVSTALVQAAVSVRRLYAISIPIPSTTMELE
jgi:hypothetical protein